MIDRADCDLPPFRLPAGVSWVGPEGQLLPRVVTLRPGSETPGRELFLQLTGGGSARGPATRLPPWARQLRLTRSVLAAVRLEQTREIESNFRALLSHRLRFQISPTLDIPATLALFDVFERQGSPSAELLHRDLRSRGVETPILMLTARTLEDDMVRGLDVGADDFLTKPYRLRGLLARVRALLRRKTASPSPVFRFGDFVLDVEARSLRGASGEIELTRTELDLLALFLRCEGKALTRHEILDEVWGRDVVVDVRTVDNFVLSLKKKLGWNRSSPFRFVALRGVGYRMEVVGRALEAGPRRVISWSRYGHGIGRKNQMRSGNDRGRSLRSCW